MKGIILAGGEGTRFYPITKAIIKQLLPVYDKPLLYYPLSVLMLLNIKDILIISTKEALPMIKKLLGDGRKLGINIQFACQRQPRGIADAFIIGKEFIKDDCVCLILGDNFFYGQELPSILRSIIQSNYDGATVFGYPVNNPCEYGVCEMDENGRPILIEEKPKKPKSKYAVPGLYFYNNDVVYIAEHITPSDRGEIEITSINNEYIRRGKLRLELLGRGVAWFDVGNPQALRMASEFVELIQNRQGFYISCIEEIAWRQQFINNKQLKLIGKELSKTDYGKYLLNLLNEDAI